MRRWPGDPDAEVAVRELFEAHYGTLAGWTAHLVGDTDLGHDFATEAFVRLLRHRESVQEPRAWLYAVTANLVRDHWRSRGRESRALGRVEAGAHRGGSVGGEAGTDADQATTLTVRDVVAALPDRLRVEVILYYYADLPLAVVAERLDKSVGAVKRDLFDARRRMAAQLEGVR